jgi:hypothetical protein
MQTGGDGGCPMSKEITTEDRRIARLVNRRRSRGMRWNKIGEELGLDWRKVYQRLWSRFPINPDGSFDLGENEAQG